MRHAMAPAHAFVGCSNGAIAVPGASATMLLLLAAAHDLAQDEGQGGTNGGDRDDALEDWDDHELEGVQRVFLRRRGVLGRARGGHGGGGSRHGGGPAGSSLAGSAVSGSS